VAIVISTQQALTLAYTSAGARSFTLAEGAVPFQAVLALVLRGRYGNYGSRLYGGAAPQVVLGQDQCGTGSGYAHVEAWIWTDPTEWAGDTLSWVNSYNDCAIAAFGIGSDSGGVVSLAGQQGECNHGWSGQTFGPVIDAGTGHESVAGFVGCSVASSGAASGTSVATDWTENGRVGGFGSSMGAYYRSDLPEGNQQHKWVQQYNNRRHASIAAAFTEAAGGGAKHQAIIIAS
jgi:hypothetical protein